MKKASFLILFITVIGLGMLLAQTFTGLTRISLTNSTVNSTTIGATTPSTGVFTSSSTTQHVLCSTAHCAFSVNSCTTAASANAACNSTVTLPVTYADTSYLVSCQTAALLSGGAVVVVGDAPSTTSAIVLQIQNLGANAAASQWSVHCFTEHS